MVNSVDMPDLKILPEGESKLNSDLKTSFSNSEFLKEGDPKRPFPDSLSAQPDFIFVRQTL
jgi:hypothetical protein